MEGFFMPIAVSRAILPRGRAGSKANVTVKRRGRGEEEVRERRLPQAAII